MQVIKMDLIRSDDYLSQYPNRVLRVQFVIDKYDIMAYKCQYITYYDI